MYLLLSYEDLTIKLLIWASQSNPKSEECETNVLPNPVILLSWSFNESYLAAENLEYGQLLRNGHKVKIYLNKNLLIRHANVASWEVEMRHDKVRSSEFFSMSWLTHKPDDLSRTHEKWPHSLKFLFKREPQSFTLTNLTWIICQQEIYRLTFCES